ncbi:hypothetical protein G7085_14415 [Tessaracoccus sp. HDW20]|uniref:hypothetical protein n=1 Tax=Tessaracoccus coleopterorum TaxID=2714950 RepID=UPI0018D3E8EF|nr:hypothetical protein [Tessaracoccus coleopterorum]NHB85409.1 hypothetical protein [Tessaracoccus coleopterorum]
MHRKKAHRLSGADAVRRHHRSHLGTREKPATDRSHHTSRRDRKPGHGLPAKAEIDVYTTPGRHFVNGRWWDTRCEKYSITTRCRTEILATVITYRNGRYVTSNTWTFNNLTYLPSPRSAWVRNPLGKAGSWTATDGRKWRTECDTPPPGATAVAAMHRPA